VMSVGAVAKKKPGSDAGQEKLKVSNSRLTMLKIHIKLLASDHAKIV
jgi:hypothetical protein